SERLVRKNVEHNASERQAALFLRRVQSYRCRRLRGPMLGWRKNGLAKILTNRASGGNLMPRHTRFSRGSWNHIVSRALGSGKWLLLSRLKHSGRDGVRDKSLGRQRVTN